MGNSLVHRIKNFSLKEDWYRTKKYFRELMRQEKVLLAGLTVGISAIALLGVGVVSNYNSQIQSEAYHNLFLANIKAQETEFEIFSRKYSHK